MILDVPERGNYSIQFKNQDSLRVWKSDFPYIFRFFKLPLEKQFIQISIH